MDFAEQTVTTRAVAGPAEVTAVYREGVGCTLLRGLSAGEVRAQDTGATAPLPPLDPATAWPLGGLVEYEADSELDALVDVAFDADRGTRAVIVVHEGRIVAERYAAPYTAETRLVGQSMTKTVAGALVGVLVTEGIIESLDAAPAHSDWSAPGDPRGNITLDMLLRMSSGLEFSEDYTNLTSDVSQCLFLVGDCPAYARARPLEYPPDTHFSYASGTSNIVSELACAAAEAAGYNRFEFPRLALFDAIGMRSAVIEPETSGSAFVGSTYGYATARDWARFGLLYLRYGQWVDGRQVIARSFMEAAFTPTRPARQGEYGYQIWLNRGAAGNAGDRMYPRLPTEMKIMSGYRGQTIALFPSKDLAILRLSNEGRVADYTEFLQDWMGPIVDKF